MEHDHKCGCHYLAISLRPCKHPDGHCRPDAVHLARGSRTTWLFLEELPVPISHTLSLVNQPRFGVWDHAGRAFHMGWWEHLPTSPRSERKGVTCCGMKSRLFLSDDCFYSLANWGQSTTRVPFETLALGSIELVGCRDRHRVGPEDTRYPLEDLYLRSKLK